MAYAASAKELAALLASATGDELEALLARYRDDPRKSVQSAMTKAIHRRDAAMKEAGRIDHMYSYMREFCPSGIILGVDEVGRGAIAGPLTVCAVALPDEPKILGLNDSKQLSPARREVLAEEIAKHALAIGICHIEPQTIDALGMGLCLKQAMRSAVENAGVEPACVLVDGNPMHIHEKEINVVKGDAKLACVAAASIVAKVTRDALMVQYDEEYPGYTLAECKGYGSQAHIQAIKDKGLTPIHRVSFCGNFLENMTLF